MPFAHSHSDSSPVPEPKRSALTLQQCELLQMKEDTQLMHVTHVQW